MLSPGILLEPVEYKALGLIRLQLADELVRRAVFERLQSACKIVCGGEEGRQAC